jgi:hypothetical protein
VRFDRFARLVYDAEPVTLTFDGDSVLLAWGVEYGKPGQLVDATAITALVQFARNITGHYWPLESVAFVNPKPMNIRIYRAIPVAPLRLNSR